MKISIASICNKTLLKIGELMKSNRPAASVAAKNAGLPGLNTISEMTGTRRNVLDGWNKHKPALFDVVVAGCAALQPAAQGAADKERVEVFLNEIKRVSQKHGLSISSDVESGKFFIGDYTDQDMDWLMGAEFSLIPASLRHG